MASELRRYNLPAKIVFIEAVDILLEVFIQETDTRHGRNHNEILSRT
jgi:hypothetical protein